MRQLVLFIFFTAFFGLLAQEKPNFSGLIIDSIAHKKAYKRKNPTGRDILPQEFSLLPYAPPIMDQGEQGTCTAYAVAYCGMSTSLLLEKGSYTPFSPMCLYNRIKFVDDTECSEGSYIRHALSDAKNHGVSHWGDYDEYLCQNDYSYDEYPDQIIDFEEINVSVNDFKQELSKYRPVVIAMRSYWDTIERVSSLSSYNVNEEGLWTCDPATYSYCDGGHAMCIIGYDDEKLGGAFLVQNSWGEDWGKAGYFWLPYEQTTYCENIDDHPRYGNLFSAFSIHTVPNYSHLKNADTASWNFNDDSKRPNPKPNPEIRDEFVVINNVPEEYTRNQSIWLSIAYESYDGWISIGWWPCLEGEETSIDISGRISDEIYYRVEDINEKKTWSGDGSMSFCTSANAFEFSSEKNPCLRKRKYGKYKVGSGILSFNLSSISRGLGEAKTNVVKINTNPNESRVKSNKNWNGIYSLIDPINLSPIIVDPKIEKDYLVWIVNDKNELEEIIGGVEKIKNMKVLKFSSEKTAKIHIAFLNQSKK